MLKPKNKKSERGSERGDFNFKIDFNKDFIFLLSIYPSLD